MRRRREDKPDPEQGRRGRDAGAPRPPYQPDSLARASQPAYSGYEIYEEYEEPTPQPHQGRPRATVVMPSVTLPSVPAMPTPSAPAQPGRSASGWRRAGGADLSRESQETGDAEDDDSWLTDQSPTLHRPAAGQPHRPTRARRAAPKHDALEHDTLEHDARATGWHDAPPGPTELAHAPYDRLVATRASLAPRPQNPHHRLTQAERIAPAAVRVGRVRRLTQRVADVVFIPAARHVVPQPVRRALARVFGVVGAIARRPTLASCIVLAVLLIGFLIDVTGVAQQAGAFSAGAWQAVAGALPSTNSVASGPITAPPNYDAKHYIDKYGFFQPGAATPISADESARLIQMLPAAIRAAGAYDKRYGKSVEPQMLLYWTHAEGIRGRINYSNCANENTRPGTSYISDIENCDHASFWQLGYGNQFGVIYVLRNAFADLYGDPNDTQLVAKVGQWVLDFDKQAGTTPACGGYSCTFPAKTIDAILSGVNLRTGVVVADNWWASVLSRDPAINSYMIAHALTYFSHQATLHWVGCYYAAPCWQRNSDRLGDILAAWPNLVKAAGIQS